MEGQGGEEGQKRAISEQSPPPQHRGCTHVCILYINQRKKEIRRFSKGTKRYGKRTNTPSLSTRKEVSVPQALSRSARLLLLSDLEC